MVVEIEIPVREIIRSNGESCGYETETHFVDVEDNDVYAFLIHKWGFSKSQADLVLSMTEESIENVLEPELLQEIAEWTYDYRIFPEI